LSVKDNEEGGRGNMGQWREETNVLASWRFIITWGNRTRKKMKACVWFFGMISKINELDTDKTVYRW